MTLYLEDGAIRQINQTPTPKRDMEKTQDLERSFRSKQQELALNLDLQYPESSRMSSQKPTPLPLSSMSHIEQQK